MQMYGVVLQLCVICTCFFVRSEDSVAFPRDLFASPNLFTHLRSFLLRHISSDDEQPRDRPRDVARVSPARNGQAASLVALVESALCELSQRIEKRRQQTGWLNRYLEYVVGGGENDHDQETRRLLMVRSVLSDHWHRLNAPAALKARQLMRKPT